MFALHFVARAVVTVAAAAIVWAGFMPAARADDRDKAGSAAGTTSSRGTGSSGMGAATAGESGSAARGDRMTPSGVARMAPEHQMKMMDKDNKGYVTKEEFMRFQEQLWNNIPKSNESRVTRSEWLNQPNGTPFP